ncbi:MAG: glycosyl hydrolase 108 family protein [Acetobacteraceae bacterium]
MPDQFALCLAFTLQQEGGFCDNPRDPGGATCQGITLATLRSWTDDDSLGVPAIRDISSSTVQAIYGADFWNKMQCGSMPAGIDLMVFDQGVNSGPSRSVRLLQQALHFPAAAIDGCVGPQTLGATAKADPAALIATLSNLQSAFYRSLSTFDEFGNGWLGRVDRRRQAAMGMLQTMTA